MSEPVTVSFARPGAPARGVVIVLTDESLSFGAATQKLLKPVDATLTRAFDGERFKGKAFSAVELIAPPRLDATRLVVISVGKAGELKDTDFLRLGGVAAGRIPAGTREATIVLDLPGKAAADAAAAVEVALGVRLRSYNFDRYKTKKTDDTERAPLALTVQVADDAGARAAWPAKEGLAEAVIFARDLVNEPANVLDPPEFARRVEAMLAPAGISIEVMDDAALMDAGLTALLGVGQGSVKESRVVVMQWKGGGAAEPVAFIGKGVTFDTGGISIKPAAGMEDMKGDMGGAAAVTGLMYALAKRKAKVNAVGIIGLVENMPDGAAQRPGDIVTSLSGQTIEIVNTDAEGRLVLADVLWYAKARFKPRFLIDLATLTGAILVALGQEHAGLFSNNDELAGRILKAGTETGERVWRLPLGPEYDKMIDSKFADMKNSGGRFAGSITAAQFLQRFVEQTPWAHLDVAGTAMASPANDISRSWGSGWGIRLLDRLVKDNYEG